MGNGMATGPADNQESTEPDAPTKDIKLTPEQEAKMGDTMSMMAWTAPGFQHLWHKLLATHNNNGQSAHVGVMSNVGVDIAATDGKNVIFNPDTYFELPLPARVFVAAHEIVHNVYGDVELLHRCRETGKVPMHDGTSVPFKNEVMQRAMDLRINALLIDSKIGKMPKHPDGTQMGQFDPKLATANDSVLDVYKRCYEDDPEGDGGGGFDSVLPPGKSTGQNPGQAANQRNPSQWAVETAAAQTLEQIRTQGRMAGALQRMFQAILEPEVPWTDLIQGIFARKVGSGGENWNRPDRRFIGRDLYLPSRSGHGAGHVVVWGDTSGSIGAGELEKYIGELSGIVEDVRPKRLTVIWCDAAISHVDECEDAGDLATIKSRGVGGGGGTSCHPVFEWIADNTEEPPDMFIAFTDGYVAFPDEPAFPVIWASVSKPGEVNYPYGDVVDVK